MIAKAIEKRKITDPTALIVGFNPERINPSSRNENLAALFAPTPRQLPF
jgi:hypothetical protein